jgi:hypothetical protein
LYSTESILTGKKVIRYKRITLHYVIRYDKIISSKQQKVFENQAESQKGLVIDAVLIDE